MQQEINLSKKMVGIDHPTYIIAEAGVNHNGNINIAKELIDVAANAGADAVKFQTFRTEEIILKAAPKAQYHIRTTGDNTRQSWFDLLKSQELNRDQHQILMDYSKSKNIDFVSTPYDIKSVDLLDEIGVIFFKIASSDTNNLLFLEYVAQKRRPIILSTAMSTVQEVKRSVNHIRKSGVEEIIVLQCTGDYPAPIDQANLHAMATIAEQCEVLVGYSDHVLSSWAAIASIAMGACVYEKHFTLDKKLPGPDHQASIEPEELRYLINAIKETESSMGDGFKRVMPCELENRPKLRKFIVAACDIKKGEIYTRENITTKRTGGLGFPSDYIYEILGKIASKNIHKDEIIDVI